MYFIRKEKKKDAYEIHQLLSKASKKNETPYDYQLSCLKKTKDFLKDLTFVAEKEGTIVGYVTLVRSKIKGKGQEEIETLMLMGPFMDEENVNQELENLLIKTILGEAKFLAFHHVVTFNKDITWENYGFSPLDTLNITVQNASFEGGYFLLFKDIYQDELKGELYLSSCFENASLEEAIHFQKCVEEKAKAKKKNQKKVTMSAFGCAMFFTLVAVVFFVLRMKEIVSPSVGLGTIVIAIGGCFASIGVSYLVTQRKAMGWFSAFLAMIISILGMICLFN